jgi:transposase
MNPPASAPSSAHDYAALEADNARLSLQVKELTRQLDWFKRQLFGRKSEQRLLIDPAIQPLLSGLVTEPPATTLPPATESISYERRKKQRDASCVTEEGLRFDATVPVETIVLPVPEAAGAHEVIGEEVTHKLAQRPGSYVVLKYVRPVVKRRADGKLLTAAAPATLWPGSLADVSLIAGMLIDKFCHHLPLYRQHRRLQEAGVTLSRPVLSQWTSKAARLLAPIHDAQLRHILQSKTLAMDETPIKAGRDHDRHRMRTGWYWPVYGEDDEITFVFAATRARAQLHHILGPYRGTLLSDGAAAYASFARQQEGVTHAQCWAHARRMFVAAEMEEPGPIATALAHIGVLYAIEDDLRRRSLAGEAKLEARCARALPAVDAFYTFVDAQCHRLDLLPSSRLAKALGYVREREGALRVYLGDPTVAIDTNHLERALRTVPMGRKNWLFCWTEVGAEHVGILQSLLTTCRLQDINPYAYLVDVLQRVAIHPDKDIEALTPRVWKTRFADNPLRSDLFRITT